MAQIESGRSLGLDASKIYKGEAKHNGMLLKLHENSFTTGYTKLTPKTGDSGVKFGSGVWYADAAGKTGEVTPVRADSNPFAGILVRQNYIAEGIPNENDETAPWNRGLLVKEGFIVYKTGTDDAADDQTIADVAVGMKMLIDNTTGAPKFATNATAVGSYTAGGAYCAGVIVQINPDDSSWTVKVSC